MSGSVYYVTFVMVLLITASEATFDTVVVTIANDLNLPLTMHCQSNDGADKPTGTQTIANGLAFTFSFKMDLFSQKKWYCDFFTSYGRGNYAVFDKRLSHDYCGKNCIVHIRPLGPCWQSNFKPGQFYCQPWKS